VVQQEKAKTIGGQGLVWKAGAGHAACRPEVAEVDTLIESESNSYFLASLFLLDRY